MRRARLALVVAACVITSRGTPVTAQTAAAQRVLELRFTPTARAQIALWVEKPDGTFLKTIGLTQAVASRGIGNRPGAAHMNSGFHWPYGRREGTLPIWAHRRAAAPGAVQFQRIIFQNRQSEGDASRTSEDSTTEKYFCLSFNTATTQKDALDAVSCASGFSSDKGRYIKAADVTAGYDEPIGGDTTRPLDLVSLYPPRRDVTRCPTTPNCIDTADVANYANDARTAMPDIDTVTMATPPGGDMEQSILFAVPDDWADGNYVAWAEVNTEGDSNASYTFDTPQGSLWDSWAESYGYSYRGQPSVAFSVPFTLGVLASSTASVPTGYGDVDGFGSSGGAFHPEDGTITDDPNQAPGSGADRFRLLPANNYRFKVSVRGGTVGGGTGGAGGAGGGSGGAGGGDDTCQTVTTPGVPVDVKADHVADPKNSYQWGDLQFVVPASAQPIHNYEVRYSTNPITVADPTTFVQALPAVSDSLENQALVVPTTGAPGTAVDVQFGGLTALTTYYVAIRAVNICAVPGPYTVAVFKTDKINFTKLSGCFVATAAFGSAMLPQVESLRVARDALRRRSALFAAATDLYYRSGPAAAAVIARSDSTRAVVRTLLAPLVDIATAAEAAAGH
ncbi:MAG TPA: CFI-box-CTERM domain-containing protein [Polyangia bacterium]